VVILTREVDQTNVAGGGWGRKAGSSKQRNKHEQMFRNEKQHDI